MSTLPKGFCYLHNVDPSIPFDIAYASNHNFIGRPLDGYETNSCITLTKVAKALSRAQKKALALGYSLKILDAYRPVRAVEDILSWVLSPNDQKMKHLYYPNLSKFEILEKSFVKLRSHHSRAAAVDLTLSKISSSHNKITYADVDMGSIFDFFDQLSHTWSPDIQGEPRENRLLLFEIMESEGFENYEKEWWHFTFVKSPINEFTYYDFPVR